MSKSVFDQKIKQMTFNKLSDAEKTLQREKVLETIFLQLTNKENRYIFYCPDIAVINNLTKLVYETAYEVKELGYSVLILHEINGFKCKWLFEKYEHLKDLDIDYIIKKKGKKSKKTQSDYAFKPSDTLIIPDQFQEILDNIANVKLIQKAILVSSYTGISSMQPGMDFNTLGVSKLFFIEKKLQDDYTTLFNLESSSLVDKYPVNQDLFNREIRKKSEVYPVISISNIGNNDLTQEVINIFYNKYPQLRTFTFKVMPRDSYDYYLDTLKHSALFLILDKNMGNSQMIYEALSVGCPVATFKRREVEGTLGDYIVVGSDGFEIADTLAEFAQAWLNLPTEKLDESADELAAKINLKDYTYENFQEQVHEVIKELQDNRVKYFSQIKKSIEAEAEKEVAV